MVHDLDGNFLYANQKTIALHGYSREEFLKLKLQNLNVPESAALIRPRIDALMRRGEISFEVQHFRKDGTRIPLLVNVKRGQWGGKDVFVSIATDITRQKWAEEEKDTKLAEETTERARVESELRSSEEKFHSLVRNIPDVIWTSDENGNTPYINEGVTKVFGFTPEEIVTTPDLWFSRIHRDDLEGVKKAYEELVKHNTLFDIEYRLQRKDGAWIWVHDRASNVYTKGNIRYVDGIFRDITEHKRIEDALQKSEAYYRSLFVNSFYGIVATGPDFKFQQVNNAFCKMLEYNAEELIGKKDILDVTYPEDRISCKELLGKVISREVDHFILEKRYVAKSGRIVNAINFCQGIYDGTGRYIGGSVSILDITDRKLAEEELLRHRDHLEELVKERTRELEVKNTKFAEEITERKRVESALRESEKIFRTLTVSSPNMIFINQGGRIVYVNRRCLEMMGYSQDELYDPHFDFMRLIAPEYWESIRDRFRRHATGAEVSSMEYTLVTKDGRRIAALYDSRLIPYQGKSAILGVVTDITERKRAEISLRESEAQLKDAQRLGRIGSWELDLETNKITWSDETFRLYDRDPALGPPTIGEEAGYYSQEQNQRLREYADRANLEGKSYKYDLEATLQSGRHVLFSATMQPIKNADGRVIKLFGTVQDITERKQAEEELRESEERYRLLFERVSDIIIVMDVTGLVLSISPSVSRILGQDPKEIEGRKFWDLSILAPRITERAKERFSKINLKASNTGISNTPIIWEMRTKTGRMVVLEILATPIIKDGKPTLIISVARDITARKIEEEKLRQIEQERQSYLEKTLQISDLKSSLITQAAHELKTPLTAILGWGELLFLTKTQGKSVDATFDIEDLETIVRNAERLNDIINEFLDVGRIESGKFGINKESIDFSEIIESATRAVNYLATQKSISLITVTAPPVRISVDQRRMEQVLINILSNAIKYSPEHTRVTIETGVIETSGRKMFEVQVIDEGYGFTPEELAEATTPFGKVYTRQDQKRFVPGTGLGLFISRRIIEQHGGTLAIRSEGANKGTQVKILLPLG